jgi:hypothetical protein
MITGHPSENVAGRSDNGSQFQAHSARKNGQKHEGFGRGVKQVSSWKPSKAPTTDNKSRFLGAGSRSVRASDRVRGNYISYIIRAFCSADLCRRSFPCQTYKVEWRRRWGRENLLVLSSTRSSLRSPFPTPHSTIPLVPENPPAGVLEPNHPDPNSIHSSVSEDPPTTGSTRKRGNRSVWRAEKRRRITMQISERVPEDLLTPIFEQLRDQRDLYACSLVSRTFNRAVTPILYRSWDTRVVVDLPANDRFVRSHKVFVVAMVQRSFSSRISRSSTRFKPFWKCQNCCNT